MPDERRIRWLAQLQRVQDLLSQCHNLSLVVLDRDCTELTVPSGLPPDCGSADPGRASTCWRLRREALSRVTRTRRAAGLPCPKGRICFLSPMGVDVDDFETPVEVFLAGSGPPDAAPAVRLVQDLFRLIGPPAPPRPEVPAELASPRLTPSRQAAGNLTRREREILALIGAGLSNRQIAERLYVSQATVKTHITHLLQKLGLSNRTEAALYAVRESAKAPRGE